jgi:hypothetical protein
MLPGAQGKSKTVTRRLPFFMLRPLPWERVGSEEHQAQKLTQTQLENQRFGFAGKNKVDIQLHAAFHFGKGRLDFARIGFNITRTLAQRGQGSSASARLVNTRL